MSAAPNVTAARHYAANASAAIDAARAWLIFGSVVYVGLFVGTYVAFTAQRYDYFGLGLDVNWGATDFVLFFAAVIWPAFFLPARMRRPSDLFLLVQYSLVYVPTMFLIQHSTLPILDPSSQSRLRIALTAGMAIMIWARRSWQPLRLPRVQVRASILWVAVIVALVLSLVFLASILASNFRLARLDEIYDVRDGVTEIMETSGSRFNGYPFFWANNVLLPLLFAAAAFRRSLLLAAVVIGGYIFLFGIWGAKMSLLAPLYLLMFFMVLSLRREAVGGLMLLGMAALLLVPAVIPDSGFGGIVREWWIAIVNARTFNIPSLLVVQYLDFFQHHPLTLGSHITGLNWWVDYPYDLDISRTVGYHYYGVLVTSNVNFWAQDGIAGMGAAGVPVISLVVALVLWLVDAAAEGLQLRFVGTALGAVFSSFLTASIFTTMLTGGLILMSIFFWLLPREQRLLVERAGRLAAPTEPKVRALVHSIMDRARARASGSLLGRYPDFEAALRACAGQGYESARIGEIVAAKTARLLRETTNDNLSISPAEARIFLAIACAGAGAATVSVLDFGGACGAHLVRARAFFRDRLRLQWTIVETPEMIGAARAHGLGDDVRYFDSLDAAAASTGQPDLLLCSGALQYVPAPLDTLEALLAVRPKNFCLTRLPLAQAHGGFFRLQRTRLSSNGPGPLPAGVADAWLRYPMAVIDQERLDARLRASALTWRTISEEGVLYHAAAGFIRFATYLGLA